MRAPVDSVLRGSFPCGPRHPSYNPPRRRRMVAGHGTTRDRTTPQPGRVKGASGLRLGNGTRRRLRGVPLKRVLVHAERGAGACHDPRRARGSTAGGTAPETKTMSQRSLRSSASTRSAGEVPAQLHVIYHLPPVQVVAEVQHDLKWLGPATRCLMKLSEDRYRARNVYARASGAEGVVLP